MQPLHFKKKYMEMLNAFWIEVVKKRYVLKTSILDKEGEQITIPLGEMHEHEDILYLADAPFDFVAAFLYQKAKQENLEIEGLDAAIRSLIARWKSPTLTFEHLKNSPIIRFTDKIGKQQKIHVLYEELAAIVTRSFNSICVLLEQLKGNPVLFPDDEEIEFIQYVSFSHLSMDTEMFLTHYKLQLDDNFEKFEMCENYQFMSYVHLKYPQVIIEQKEALYKENIKTFQKKLDNEYNVTSQLLKRYYQKESI